MMRADVVFILLNGYAPRAGAIGVIEGARTGEGVLEVFSSIEYGRLCTGERELERCACVVGEAHRLAFVHDKCGGCKPAVDVGNEVLEAFLRCDIVLRSGGRGVCGENGGDGGGLLQRDVVYPEQVREGCRGQKPGEEDEERARGMCVEHH